MQNDSLVENAFDTAFLPFPYIFDKSAGSSIWERLGESVRLVVVDFKRCEVLIMDGVGRYGRPKTSRAYHPMPTGGQWIKP
jgi:hypothetical protein